MLGVDALVVHAPADLRWACGFTGSNGLLVWGRQERRFVTDGRYATQAASEVRGARVDAPGYDLVGFLREEGVLHGSGSVAFAADTMTVAMRDRFVEAFPAVSFTGVTGLFAGERMIKSEGEVRAIRTAQQLAERVLHEVADSIREGMSERQVAARITERLLAGGAERTAFEPIVAAGPRSALPHARPTDAPIGRGEAILLDFGCVVDGYASDMTRMLCLGPPPDELVRVFDIVLRALEAGERAVRAGVPAKTIDEAARTVIADAGLAEQFPHSLGHGVGLEVHEAPTLSWRTAEPVPEHAVVTLEPGVYLPGQFGVRIEDLVRVTPSGTERLTAVDRDLIIR